MDPASPTDFIRTLKEGEYTSLWSGQNIDTYMGLLEEYKANPGRFPEGYTDVEGTKYFLRENDILGDMFETGFKQTHNISAQGGSDRIDYRLSLGYTDEDGVMVSDKDAFSRTNVSSYVNGNITNWLSTSLTMNYSRGKKVFPCTDPASPLNNLWFNNQPSYHPVGVMSYGDTNEIYPVKTPENLVRYSGTSNILTDNTRILSRTVLKPFKGLKAVLEYSYQSNATDKESYVRSFKMHQGLTEAILPSTATNPYTEERGSTKYTTINAFADYTASFNKVHNIYALAGFNQEKSTYRFVKAQAFNMISTDLPSLNGSDGTSTPKISDNYKDYALRSGFVRATYNYNHLYFLEFNGRYDLSSKFPKDYRGGFFPSVSAAWNLGKEKFMEKANSVLSTLKIRASYGNLGNQNIQPYSYLPTMNIFDAPWISGDIRPKTVSAPGMVRANFTWEKVESINGGIDFGFLNNQLTGSFDIYRRNTKGMLGPSEELPLVAGAGAPLQNAADLKSVGWELSMNWKDVIGAVSYELGFNLYDSRSHITKYKNDTGLIQNNLYRKGMEIGEIWGFITDGFYTADDFDENGVLKEGVVSIRGVNSHEGDIKYKNLKDDENSVNVIDEGNHTEKNPGDRVIIGNNRPRFQYGINGNLKWKGLSFSFLLQGVGKCDAWIGGPITFPMPDQWNTVYQHQVGKIWTKDNPNAFYGRIYENAGSSQSANQRVSDKFLYNANYLRVKNLTFSYTFPRQWMQAMKIQNLTAFVSGENLFTFDHLPKGVDPENLNWSYPYSKTISFGINFNL